MKKIILALACFAGLTITAKADVKGWTKPRPNGANGTSYDCKQDPNKICNSSVRNPNGTLTTIIRLYDDEGNLTGTKTIVFPSAEQTEPDPENGLIHEVPTEYGTLWGIEVAN